MRFGLAPPAVAYALAAALIAPAGLLAADDPVPNRGPVSAPAEGDGPAGAGQGNASTQSTPLPAPPSPAGAGAAPATPAADAAPTAAGAGKRSAAAKRPAAASGKPVAFAAGAGAVLIKGFAFRPATITVTAGDSVTWTNADTAPHSATGSGFDTGVFGKGKSRSVRFSKPGTFAYICSVHPNMHGTVRVVAAASGGGSSGGGSSSGNSSGGNSSGGGSSGGGSSSAGAPSTGSSSSGGATAAGTSGGSAGTLAKTGADAGQLALLGALLLALGVLARRRAAEVREEGRDAGTG